MTWFKVDDKLHDHRKVRKAGTVAMGLWVLAGSWSADNRTDGFVPATVVTRWGSAEDAGALVAAGLWALSDVDGEQGWLFHDWADYQPSAAVTAAKQAAEREAGQRGNHRRWHLKRGIVDPSCEYCYRVPDQEPDQGSGGEPDRESDQVSIGGPESAPNRPVPVPEPEPHVSPDGETSRRSAADAPRVDVERICTHLADRIEANGSRRPAIGQTWRDSARLMLDRDQRLPDDVHDVIDWCQDSDFWRANVLSVPKLREKFDQLRLQSLREREAPAQRSNLQGHLDLVERLGREAHGGQSAVRPW